VQRLRALRSEFRPMFRLAVPVVMAELGWMTMGIVDTLMVGRLSPESIGAVGIGTSLFMAVIILAMGVQLGLDTLVSQAYGAGRLHDCHRWLLHGVALAVVVTVPLTWVLIAVRNSLDAWGLHPTVLALTRPYLDVVIWSVLPLLLYTAFRRYLQGMGVARPVMIALIVANLTNVFFNWVLIFGKLGAPALGVAGAAWATSASRWVMIVVLLTISWRQLHQHLRPLRADTFALAPLRRMLALGTPIGLQFQLEYGIFAVVGLLMGTLGTPQLAGHQVALNIASFTFMVPMGIGAAVAVLVGHAVGRDDPIDARRAAVAALVTGVGFMIGAALALLAAPGLIARIYTTDAAVTAVALVLIPLAGFFQVFDGMQVVCGGILRGLGDTHSPLIANILGFWVIGLPLGLWLGMRQGHGPAGLWWGLVVGLAVVGVGLLLRVRVRLRRTMRRVEIDYVASNV
jgi:MATE family multidrug resistance protein